MPRGKKAAPEAAEAKTPKVAMTKIKLKRNLFLESGKAWAGEIVEVEDQFARRFVSEGGAVFVED